MTPIDPQPSILSGELINLVISEKSFIVNGQTGTAMTINGTIPGPLIHLKEGQEVALRVTNRLAEITSIHWHGILLPPEMDGVPGVSFEGIQPDATFTYRFPLKQSGTYWFHSHSGGQEMRGMYAPMIIDPIEPEPFQYDREYVVMLSDWTFESPEGLFDNLKKQKVIRAFRNHEVSWGPYGYRTKQGIRVRGQLFAWQEVCVLWIVQSQSDAARLCKVPEVRQTEKPRQAAA